MQEAKEAKDRKKFEEGLPVLPNTKDLIQGGLRLFSVARIVIGVMVDGVSVNVSLSSSLESLSKFSSLFLCTGSALLPLVSSSHGALTGGMLVGLLSDGGRKIPHHLDQRLNNEPNSPF